MYLTMAAVTEHNLDNTSLPFNLDEDDDEVSEMNQKVVYCVLLEMALSFLGILCNLLVVTTIRHHEEMQNSTTNLLLINLCFSNLLISFLVKPISAIYAGYSMSTGSWQVLSWMPRFSYCLNWQKKELFV